MLRLVSSRSRPGIVPLPHRCQFCRDLSTAIWLTTTFRFPPPTNADRSGIRSHWPFESCGMFLAIQ